MDPYPHDDLLLVIIGNLETNFDFKDFSKDNLRKIVPYFDALREIILDTIDPPTDESLEQLIAFWNKKVGPNLHKFFSNPNLLSIIDELDLRLEKHVNRAGNTAPTHRLVKSFSTFNFLNQGCSQSSTFNGVSAGSGEQLSNSTLSFDKDNDCEFEVLDFSTILAEHMNGNCDSNSPKFLFKKEIDETDVLFDSNGTGILYIGIDYLIQSISRGGFIDKYRDVVNGICQQHSAFIPTEVFLKKITSAFTYYYSHYQNGDFNNEVLLPYDIILLLRSLINYSHSLIISNPNAFKKITEFLRYVIQIPEIRSKYESMIISLQNKLLEPKSNPSFLFKERSTSVIPLNSKSVLEQFNLFKTSPANIAQELTRVTLNYFNRIEAHEFLSAKFIQKDKTKSSPNIIFLIDRFNSFSLFIIEEILSYDYSKVRAKVLTHFIQIADELRRMNNFNDCFNVTAALNHMILKRLKKTWKQVPAKSIMLYNELQKLISFENNYQLLRLSIAQCIDAGQLFIPYLGFYAQTISFIEEKMKYIKDSVLINCDKIVKVHQCLEEFFLFKQHKDRIDRVEGLEILQFLSPLKENELEKQAMLTEPAFLIYSKQTNNKRSTHTDIAYHNAKLSNNFKQHLY